MWMEKKTLAVQLEGAQQQPGRFHSKLVSEI